ncbi:bridging integrator 2a [Kryptolebias marmoratus]|uniref:Bridging integrator 2a n=1 Tax=Kryptolebias marmoratus TaxID=37003 RepID=A0A3Q2ZU84_KRYMA|nr:bridging integrator 2a [Kryptolebias marmoratus]
MADSTSPKGTSGDFAKKVQRQLSRGKEKVLQKLGKTLENRDDQFDQCLQIFSEQQSDGNRIHKDLRNYINAVRDMREASRRLSQSLFEVYESDWAGEEDLGAIVEGEDLLWNDFEVKLIDQAVHTMESYVGQFPDMREKIAKRGRKLVDYDSSLRHLEALQLAKKRDDVKINKAKEELKAAKTVYDGINNELKDELPVLYDSRIGCYVSVFSSVSNLRDIFYKEMNTLNLDLQCIIKELQAQHPDKVFAVRGVQRYGSLRRRTLMSPKAWKASFSEFHRGYSPRTSQRYSFRSSDRSRHGTLSRESSTLGVSTQANPLSESRELDAASSCNDEHSSEGRDASAAAAAAAAAAETSGNELKSEEGGGEAGGEKGSKKDGGRAPPSESSSELNVSCDSESLDLQLSAAHSGPLHIEEDDPAKPSALENGVVDGSVPEPRELSTPRKDVPAGKEAAQDTKTTTV